MRSWFILFTTSFTITSLVLAVATWLIVDMAALDSKYIGFLAISSALLSIFMNRPIKRKNIILTVFIDILFIFIIVFATAVIIGIYPVSLISGIITASLVIIIYIIITLIYYFILTKEADEMNRKIKEWRTKHVDC